MARRNIRIARVGTAAPRPAARQPQRPTGNTTPWANLDVGTVGTCVNPKTGRTHMFVKVFATKKSGGTRIVALDNLGLVCSAQFSKNWNAYAVPTQVIGKISGLTFTVN